MTDFLAGMMADSGRGTNRFVFTSLFALNAEKEEREENDGRRTDGDAVLDKDERE